MATKKDESKEVAKLPEANLGLSLWGKVEKTDPNFTKDIPGGAGLTAIDAMYQVKMATQIWGPYGFRWGLKNMQYSWLEADEQNKMVVIKAVFKYPANLEPVIEYAEFEIGSSFSWMKKGRVDFDFLKKTETDLLTKALSKVGFNADIYMGRFDDSKYVAERKAEVAKSNPEKLTKEKL